MAQILYQVEEFCSKALNDFTCKWSASSTENFPVRSKDLAFSYVRCWVLGRDQHQCDAARATDFLADGPSSTEELCNEMPKEPLLASLFGQFHLFMMNIQPLYFPRAFISRTDLPESDPARFPA